MTEVSPSEYVFAKFLTQYNNSIVCIFNTIFRTNWHNFTIFGSFNTCDGEYMSKFWSKTHRLSLWQINWKIYLIRSKTFNFCIIYSRFCNFISFFFNFLTLYFNIDSVENISCIYFDWLKLRQKLFETCPKIGMLIFTKGKFDI